MKFKTLLLTLALLVSINSSFSQIRIGDFSFAKYKFKKANKKNLNRFNAKTTKFIFPDLFPKSSYENILKEVWNVTPYEIIYTNDFKENEVKEGDALAQFITIVIAKTKTYNAGTIYQREGIGNEYLYNILDFHVVDKIKKKPIDGQLKWYSSKIGTIYFTPDIEQREQAVKVAIKLKKGLSPSQFDNNELTGGLLNFRLGYLKNFLQFTNNSIKNSTSINLYEDISNKELKNLKNNTLFIDKNFIYSYNAWAISKKESPSIEELMKDFSFDYRVVEYEEIEKMILNNQSSDFYYLMYNQINSNKIISVINGHTSDIIYQKPSAISYNIKSKDFKELDKKIKKIK